MMISTTRVLVARGQLRDPDDLSGQGDKQVRAMESPGPLSIPESKTRRGVVSLGKQFSLADADCKEMGVLRLRWGESV